MVETRNNEGLTCAKCASWIPDRYNKCPTCETRNREINPSDGSGLMALGLILAAFGVILAVVLAMVLTGNMERVSGYVSSDARIIRNAAIASSWATSIMAGGVLIVPGFIVMALGVVQKSLAKIQKSL